MAMETKAVRSTRAGLLAGRSPLLRLQSDERLIALIRSGNDAAFDVLFERYRSRLLAFCRHMLGSKEDAEDVLQEVFAASYNAMRADDRALNVRPWLYRIARNRCLNHLRRPRQDGRDTMDDQLHGNGVTTADLVHRRADFRHLLEDIQKLPETQRTALLLREVDVLSYEQIADAMETTVPSVKSLLVRARMSLAEAAESRTLTCGDVRRELAEVAEGLKRTTSPVRRHVRDCEQCRRYRTQLHKTTNVMAMALPFGPLLIMKKLLLAKLGASAAAAGGAASAGAGGAAAGGAAAGGAAAGGLAAGGAAAGGLAAGGAGTAGAIGLGAVATKAITVAAATALLAGGAVEVQHKLSHPAAQPKVAAAPAPSQTPAADRPASAAVKAPPEASAGDGGKPAASKPEEEQAAKAESSETATTAPPVATDPASGTTGPADATTGEQPAPGAAPEPSPPAQTGGASLPPSVESEGAPAPAPAPQPTDGTQTPTGGTR
jgi:RNA polymerase sigma factor (sigma-70 family)